MRIGIVTLLFCVMISAKVQAQNYYVEDERTFYGGLIAGTTFTQVDGDNFAGYSKAGFTFGAVAYAHLVSNVRGSIEILYTQKGARSNGAKASNNRVYLIEKYGIDLNYAEVPVMINYFVKRKSNFGAGLSYSQLISSKEMATTKPTFPDTIDLDQFPFKKYDLNFLLGGSLHLYKGLYLSYRFQYSLLPVRTKIYPEFGRPEQYNNMHILRVMYVFD